MDVKESKTTFLLLIALVALLVPIIGTGAQAPGEPAPCALVRTRCPGTRAFCLDVPAR